MEARSASDAGCRLTPDRLRRGCPLQFPASNKRRLLNAIVLAGAFSSGR